MSPVLIRIEDRGRVKTGDEIVCSKSCYIKIENSMNSVLWEFRLSETVMLNATAQDTNYLIEEESHFQILNTLFHLKCLQWPTKQAYESLEEDKPVQARDQPEPNNDYDQQAISVYINVSVYPK